MPHTPIDIVTKQAESFAKNRLRAEAASLRRETSIVNQASKLMGRAVNEADKKKEKRAKLKSGVYATTPEGKVKAPVIVAADGYVRRTPVQALYVHPGYRRRMLQRIIMGIVVIIVLAFALYMLLGYII